MRPQPGIYSMWRLRTSNDWWKPWANVGIELDIIGGATGDGWGWRGAYRAMQVPAVWACIYAIVTRAVQLEVEAIWRDGRDSAPPPQPMWMEEAVDDMPTAVIIAQLLVGQMIDGCAILMTRRDGGGAVNGLYVAESGDVTWTRPPGIPEIMVRIGGHDVDSSMRRVVRHPVSLPGTPLGASPLRLGLRRPAALAAGASDQAQDWFDRGLVSPGVVMGDFDPKERRQFYDDWDEWHKGGGEKSHRPIMLDNAKWIPITISPAELQALESREFSNSEIAAAFGLDASVINSNKPGQSLTYANVQQAEIQTLTGALGGPLSMIERAFTACLPRDQRARIRTSELLRLDAKTLWEVLFRNAQITQMSGDPVLTNSEIRRDYLRIKPTPETADTMSGDAAQ